MALIAVHAVVDVSAHPPVLAVGVGLAVAVGALEDAVVIRIGVAGAANTIGAAVIHVEPGVTEGGALPARGGVAGRTRRGETDRHVVRIGRPRVVRLVASVAVGGQGRVVVVYVAACAAHRGMRTGQRERGVVVIKRCRRPGTRAVAYVALLRESRRDMVGIG